MENLKIIFVLLFIATAAFAQQENKLPVIKSNVSQISIQDGEKLNKNGWRLSPEAKPDVYEAGLVDGKSHKVTFITDVDQISFTVEEGKKYDFIIEWEGKLCYQQIVGTRFTPAAVFDKKYQSSHRGKTFVEIPEVYELVNIAFAMTPIGIEHRNLIYKDSEYYKRMRQWFDKYQDHPFLAALNAELERNFGSYHNLKMNGHSFEFDKNNKIVQSRIYNRSGWGKTNPLLPYLAQMQSFSDASNFRRFYKQNQKTYQEQISFYRNVANIAGMKHWLDKNFPTSNNYDTYKIIFSPLVYANQSSASFANDGFKELQPHVNFPYTQDVKLMFKDAPLSGIAEVIFRGNIVFTEINHGYIGPEGFKYSARINKAVSNRDRWVDKKMGANYYSSPRNVFDEYMNWALVSLRFVDSLPRDEQDKMIAAIDRMMTRGRSFPQFEAFDKFLVNLYRNRKPNQTVADLYPQIIEWFEKNNQPELKAAEL